MDLDEWEFLPDSKSFLDFGGGSGCHASGKQLFKDLNFDGKMVLEMDYFICPAHSARAPIKAQVDSVCKSDEDLDKEFKDIDVVPPPPPPPPPPRLADQEEMAQVFFKKIKENEFVDMKMSCLSSNSSKGMIMPYVESESDPIPVEEEEDEAVKEMRIEEEEEEESMGSDLMVSEAKKKPCNLDGISVSIWRWKMTGIGALFSIGAAAAAATISVFMLGGHNQKQQHQKIQFQLYSEDKRFKQAVQQAARLNQALSGARGAPMTRAHISFGGYYEGL